MTDEERISVINYRVRRARETLVEVQFLIDNSLFYTAVNRLYYACFYAVSGLLLSKDIAVKTHKGVMLKFGSEFVSGGLIGKASGKFYTEIFASRQKGDYEDLIEFDKDDVSAMLQPARELIKEIENILSM
ncbi:MAG: HEPN domain-containing protein [Bacteroidota bacterium]